MTELDAAIAAHVAHLRNASLDDVLAGRVERPALQPALVPGVRAVDGRAGPHDIPVRWYLRDDASATLRPAIVWAHGGAWIAGDLDMPEADAVARRLCARLDAVVCSVDYRLAPQYTHPAALDDLLAAFDATTAHPRVDAERVVIGGASAGGTLAALAAQQLRDRAADQPVAVVLAYPATNPAGGPYDAVRPDVCPPVLWLDRAVTAGAFALYVGAESTDDTVETVAPAAHDLSGLPRTLVTTAAIDALADQAVAYVETLRAAEVEVTHHLVDAVLHGYLNLTGVFPIADRALDRHIEWIAAALTQRTEQLA
ncbi:MAG: alpha/beta hydrolase [Actinomycetota bacterium]